MGGELIDEKKEQITRKERKYFLLMLMVELQLTGREKKQRSPAWPMSLTSASDKV